jgi:hypothetical protein
MALPPAKTKMATAAAIAQDGTLPMLSPLCESNSVVFVHP